MPFEYDELTIENVKAACQHHFPSLNGPDLVCDILAGEQGPSCRTIDQVPDTKVIHVRFVVNEGTGSDRPATAGANPSKKARVVAINSVPVAVGSLAQRSTPKIYPKSLSVSDMLKLGRTIEKTTTLVEVFIFNLDQMSWSRLDHTVKFSIAKEPFASGGFRNAHNATSLTKGFEKLTWVIKKYFPDTLNVIQQINETVESHTKKVVQMHHLAYNFGEQIVKEIVSKSCQKAFGRTLRYKNIYLGKIGEEFVTIEEYISGCFIKYMNNTGQLCVDQDDEFGKKSECLAHFSYEKSQQKLMVVDIQGSENNLYDPEVASSDWQEEGKVLFCAGNFSTTAIENFVNGHKCNCYCNLLDLKPLGNKA